jgi:hypothetical protein
LRIRQNKKRRNNFFTVRENSGLIGTYRPEKSGRINPYRKEGRFEMNAKEFVESMEKVIKTLSKIIKEENYETSKGREYLGSVFGTNRELFCRFVGFMESKMKTMRISKDIFPAVIMAGISIGWSAGYADAKSIYSAG